ncbi:hypothetical protein Tco_1382517 [Tanacetum coccineum]
MDNPNFTMEEYIRLEEEKARRHGQTFNWQTATFGKVKNYEDEYVCSIDFETEFSAIVFDNTLTAIPSEPTICPPNENELDFRISLDESDDEDYTVIFDENSFSYKIIFVNDLKTDLVNDKPLSPNPTVDYLDYFKDLENEFPAIVYNDGLTSKSDLEPLENSEHIDEINLIDKASLSEYNEEPKDQRQQAAAAGASEADEAGPAAEEATPEIPAPAQAPPPPPPAPQPRTMSQRIERLKEEVYDLRRDVVGLRGDVTSFTTEQSRVSTWLISCMTQLMDASGQTYQPFDSTLIGSSGLSFWRRVMPRTGDASTSLAPHTDAQPGP